MYRKKATKVICLSIDLIIFFCSRRIKIKTKLISIKETRVNFLLEKKILKLKAITAIKILPKVNKLSAVVEKGINGVFAYNMKSGKCFKNNRKPFSALFEIKNIKNGKKPIENPRKLKVILDIKKLKLNLTLFKIGVTKSRKMNREIIYSPWSLTNENTPPINIPMIKDAFKVNTGDL